MSYLILPVDGMFLFVLLEHHHRCAFKRDDFIPALLTLY